MPYALNAAHAAGQTITAADQNAIAAAINQGAEHNPGLFVASSDATAAEKASADYVCDQVGDEVEINAAIAALPSVGGRVKLSAGTFKVANPIACDKDFVTIEGSGYATSIQPAPSQNPAQLIQIGVAAIPNRNVLRDFRVFGNRSAHTAGHGIVFGSKAGVVSNVFVQNTFGDAIRCVSALSPTKVQEIYFDNVTVQDPGNDGLYLSGDVQDSEFVRFICGNTVKGGRYGIYNQGSQNKFVFCHPYYMGNDGFHSTGNGPQVFGGEFENNLGWGIYCDTTFNAKILGVELYDNTLGGVYVANAAHNFQVIGNSVNMSGNSIAPPTGILVEASNYVTVEGNFVRDATSYAIRLNGANHCLVANNTARSLGAGCVGIELDHATDNRVAHNDIEGGIAETNTGGASTNSRFLYNRLSNSGTVTIASGSASSAVGNW